MSIFTLLLLFFKYYIIILVPFGHVKMTKCILESYIHMKSYSLSLFFFCFTILATAFLSLSQSSYRSTPITHMSTKKHRSFRTTYLIPLTNCRIAMMSRLKSFWTRNATVINGKLIRISPLKEQC